MRPTGGRDGLFQRLDQEAGLAVLDDFGRRAAAEGHDRRAAGHGLDHHQAEGLGPVDREQQRVRSAQERGLLMVADLADELDQRIGVDHRLDDRLPIGLVRRVDLGRHLQWLVQRRRDLDRPVRPLFGRYPAQEGEVALRLRREAIGLAGHAVVHGGLPVGQRQGPPLVVGDRHQAELGPALVDAADILHVQPPVQRGQRLVGVASEHRELDHVGVEMDHVEVVGALQHLGQHDHMRRQIGLQRGRVQPDRLIPHRHQSRACLGVRRGEQGHVMPQIDEGVGQVGHHALGAAVQPWRHGFVQRCDLGDLHGACSRRP